MRAEDKTRHEGNQDSGTASSKLYLPRTVVIVGLMGVGKSTIGRRLAIRLQVPFVDADAEIETAAGCTIAAFFAHYGEAAFRDGERRVMARLLAGPVCVLAAGGGAFMDPDIRAVIKAQAVSVWLKAELDILVNRTAGRTHRPLLQDNDPRAVLARLIVERYPVYAMADTTVESTNGPCEMMVTRVIRVLSHHFGLTLPA